MATSSTGSPTTRRSASRPTAGTSWRDIDGHDPAAIERALIEARKRPTEAEPALLQDRDRERQPEQAGSHDVHGAPLGADEIAAAAWR
jgi:transketolase